MLDKEERDAREIVNHYAITSAPLFWLDVQALAGAKKVLSSKYDKYHDEVRKRSAERKAIRLREA
jgi:hypothetical protein